MLFQELNLTSPDLFCQKSHISTFKTGGFPYYIILISFQCLASFLRELHYNHVSGGMCLFFAATHSSEQISEDKPWGGGGGADLLFIPPGLETIVRFLRQWGTAWHHRKHESIGQVEVEERGVTASLDGVHLKYVAKGNLPTRQFILTTNYKRSQLSLQGTPIKRPVTERPVTKRPVTERPVTKRPVTGHPANKGPDYQRSSYQKSRLPNVQITQQCNSVRYVII